MNEFCKDCLYHAWGKTPEQKQAEHEYNAGYYQQNKQRWVINKQKRQSKTQEPKRPDGVDSLDTIVTGTLSYYNRDGKGFSDYAKSGLSKMWEVAKTPVRVIKKAPSAIKSFVEEIGKTIPMKIVGKSQFAKDVKKVFSILNRCKNKSEFKSDFSTYF